MMTRIKELLGVLENTTISVAGVLGYATGRTIRFIRKHASVILIVLIFIVISFFIQSYTRINTIKNYEKNCNTVTYTYCVKEGDNLYNICKEHNPSQWMSTYEYMNSISTINDFESGNWEKLHIGEEITLYYLRSK